MNEKVTLQYLIEALTKRHQMNLKDADTFVKSFFEQIRHALERDKYVKIKGLGTFKRIGTEFRGNDNEEDEERIGMQGRFKITFTPDMSMRELINKPFSHFETVVLNEHTHFDDMDEDGMEHLPETEQSENVSDKSSDDGKPPVGIMPTVEAAVTPENGRFFLKESDKSNQSDTQVPVESVVSVTETGFAGENTSDEELVTDDEKDFITEESATSKRMFPLRGDSEVELQEYENSEEEFHEHLLKKTIEPEVPEQVVSDDDTLNVPQPEVLEEVDSEEEEKTASATEQPEEDLFPSNETENTIIGKSPKVAESLPIDSDKKSQKEKRSKIPWCMFATILLVGVLIGGGVIWALLSGRRYIPESLLRELISEKKVNNEMLALNALEKKKKTDMISVMDSMKTDSIKKKQDSMVKKSVNLTLPATPSSVSVPTIKSATPAKQDKPKVVKRETLADTMEYTITGTMDTYTLQNGESLVKVALKYYGNKKLWPYIVRHNRKIIKNPDNVPVGTILQIPKLSPKNEQ